MENGKKVKIEYEGKLEDGTVFDSSERGGGPIEFEIGAGQVIKGFEDAVLGMKVGEEKDIKLSPAEAYGDVDPSRVQKVPRDKIPAEAEKGGTLLMTVPTGQQIPVKITELDEKEATLDLNHPLAGKTLNFHLKLVEVN